MERLVYDIYNTIRVLTQSRNKAIVKSALYWLMTNRGKEHQECELMTSDVLFLLHGGTNFRRSVIKALHIYLDIYHPRRRKDRKRTNEMYPDDYKPPANSKINISCLSSESRNLLKSYINDPENMDKKRKILDNLNITSKQLYKYAKEIKECIM